jgi:ribosomal protein S27AE/DNA polymerase elongation subunit (family B)
MSPKIILFDIETLPALATTFSLWPQSIPHDNIIKDWSIVCICWKELNSDKVNSVSVLDDAGRLKRDVYDDFTVVNVFRRAIEDADILIGHNSKKFDFKRLNARLIIHGLDPIPPKIHQVDTLQEVKKIAAFTCNRLDYLGKVLTGSGKVETSKGLWLRAVQKDKQAIAEMVNYCKGDVTLLEEVYLKLLPYMKSHPAVGALGGQDKNNSCPKCGSTTFITRHTKHVFTATGIPRIQRQCKNCNSYTTFLVSSV